MRGHESRLIVEAFPVYLPCAECLARKLILLRMVWSCEAARIRLGVVSEFPCQLLLARKR
jgi:hypothetical protein